MIRRDLIMLGAGAFAAAAAGEACAQIAPAGAWSALLHVWNDPAGVSHAEILPIAANVKPVVLTQMALRPEPLPVVDWHTPHSAMFAITIAGELEVEVSDGTKLKLPPSGVAFLEDLTGKGHITRAKNVMNMFLTPKPGFDVRRWARGEG